MQQRMAAAGAFAPAVIIHLLKRVIDAHVVHKNVIAGPIYVQVELESIIKDVSLAGMRGRVHVVLGWRIGRSIYSNGIMEQLGPGSVEVGHNVVPGIGRELGKGYAGRLPVLG